MAEHVLIVGGTETSDKYEKGTMTEYWDKITKDTNYAIKFDSSNYNNYGRHRFTTYGKLDDRVKNKYDVILFEYCPFCNIYKECDDNPETILDKSEFLSKKNDPFIVIPFHFTTKYGVFFDEENNEFIDCLNFINKKNERDYIPLVYVLCNYALKRGYNVYGILNWNQINDTIFPGYDLIVKDSLMRDGFVIITKMELNFPNLSEYDIHKAKKIIREMKKLI